MASFFIYNYTTFIFHLNFNHIHFLLGYETITMRPRNNSLRKMLVAIAMITTTLTLVLSNLAFISLEYYLGKQEVTEKLTILGEVIANQTGTALMFQDKHMLQNNLNALVADSSIVRGCLYGTDQKLIVSFHANAQNSCSDYLYELNSSSNLNFYQRFPIEFNDQNIGTLYIESSHSQLLSRIKTFLFFSALVLIVTLLLALALSNGLQNVVIGPIKGLNKTLNNIMRKKDFSIRAEKQNFDELGDLVDLFNSLLSTIEAENTSLKSSEDRFRKLTTLSPVGIFQINVDLHLEYVNQRWRDIHSTPGYLPSFQSWVASIHPDDRQLFDQHWQDLITKQESIKLELRLIRRDNEVIWIQLLTSALYDPNSQLLGYLGAISDISELKEAQLKMETLAFYDSLTGLANRRLFRDRLVKSIANAQRTQSSVALMFIDMDQFKRINDTLGHDAGDVLLVEVAKRLQQNVRETDTVSRVGGDEFTVLLTDVHDSHDVLLIAEKLLKTLSEPIIIQGHTLVTTVSIGITLTPEDSIDDNILMKNADLAMYRAKELGRNNIQFFSEDMNRKVLEHLEIEQEINTALAENQFVLSFQPKICLIDFKITGVEALLRWVHPEKGLIPPDKFIPIAEESGQIIEIGAWVLTQSCMQMGKLFSEGALPSNAKVAVNLSAKQFTDPRLLQDIKDAMHNTAIPPQNLELEVTESIIMEDIEGAVVIMQHLKELGVSIAIDDFGTGYSSLSYIKRFPINVLKVDRSFVTDIPVDKNDMAITAAIIAMAHKLNLTVIAEGVETQEQLNFLYENNCNEGQGYFFSRPLFLAQLEHFLVNHKPENFKH